MKLAALQHSNFALGNFIMSTPTIRYYAETLGRPLPVIFTKDYVKECFLDCEFMEHVEYDPNYKIIVSSGLINQNIPDYQFIFKSCTGKDWDSKYHTYVDTPSNYDIPKEKYIVVMNGLAGGYWKGKKEIDESTHRYIKESTNLPIYFIGSQTDLDINSPWMSDLADHIHLNDIRHCLALIKGAYKIIANDTGLSHAAGALNKDILILWKDTPFIKNNNPGKNTKYAPKGTWKENIKKFLE